MECKGQTYKTAEIILICHQVLCLFSALHGMPARTSDEKGVCPSVCLSVCQTREL